MPTVRQLAGDLGINMNTVARAYRELERQGLVSTVRRRGTRVTSDRETPRGTAKEIRERVAARLRDGLTDARLAGMDGAAIKKLIDKLAADYWPGRTS